MSLFQQLQHQDVAVIVSELMVATADSADPLLDGSISEVLRAVRDRLNMDVVFVSEFIGGKRVFRYVDSRGNAPKIAAGGHNPLEESFCQRIVDGRLPELIHDVGQLRSGAVPPLPFRLGAHLSTPIVLSTGLTYGTLCCFSEAPNAALQGDDLTLLRNCAKLVAVKVEHLRRLAMDDPAPRDHAARGPVEYVSSIWSDLPTG